MSALAALSQVVKCLWRQQDTVAVGAAESSRVNRLAKQGVGLIVVAPLLRHSFLTYSDKNAPQQLLPQPDLAERNVTQALSVTTSRALRCFHMSPNGGWKCRCVCVRDSSPPSSLRSCWSVCA
eukprot:6182144-Pleurochrysis_carterae.AAC.2